MRTVSARKTTSLKFKQKLARAEQRGEIVRKKMAAEEDGSLSLEQTAELLRLEERKVMNQLSRGKLLAWKTKAGPRFPAWQFAGKRPLHGLDAVAKVLSEGDVLDDSGKIGFFLLSHGLLHERRPLDFLRKKEVEPVLKAAEAYGG